MKSISPASKLHMFFIYNFCLLALCCQIGCVDGGKKQVMPDGVKQSLGRAYRLELETHKQRCGKLSPEDACPIREFSYLFSDTADRYAISQQDVLDIMGHPIDSPCGAYEFEYVISGNDQDNMRLLVWFGPDFTVKHCLLVARPKDRRVSCEDKVRLKCAHQELIRQLNGGARFRSSAVDARVKNIAKTFNGVLKTSCLTYRDVIEIMGTPSKWIDVPLIHLHVPSSEFGFPGKMFAVDYRFPLNDKASSAIWFVFCEATDGGVVAVGTSWVEDANQDALGTENL